MNLMVNWMQKYLSKSANLCTYLPITYRALRKQILLCQRQLLNVKNILWISKNFLWILSIFENEIKVFEFGIYPLKNKQKSLNLEANFYIQIVFWISKIFFFIFKEFSLEYIPKKNLWNSKTFFEINYFFFSVYVWQL